MLFRSISPSSHPTWSQERTPASSVRRDPLPPADTASARSEPSTREPQQNQQSTAGDPGKITMPCRKASKLILLLDQLFPLTVINTYLEKTTGKGSAKRESSTFLCNGRFAFASPAFTRADMVKRIYTEFSMEMEYVVGPENGPAFKAWFTGME